MYHTGGIAQWSEQGSHKPLVLGSSPSVPTIFTNKKLIYTNHMQTTPEQLEQLESIFDSAANEFIDSISDPDLINEFHILRQKLQAKVKELYPEYKFQNF